MAILGLFLTLLNFFLSLFYTKHVIECRINTDFGSLGECVYIS